MATIQRKRSGGMDIDDVANVPAKRVRRKVGLYAKRLSLPQIDDTAPTPTKFLAETSIISPFAGFKAQARETLMHELSLISHWPCDKLTENVESLAHKMAELKSKKVSKEQASNEEIFKKSKKHLFSFNEVCTITERLMKDHEEKLLQQFEKAMVTEMAHQYDRYVKFTYDQIRQKYNGVPYYLS